MKLNIVSYVEAVIKSGNRWFVHELADHPGKPLRIRLSADNFATKEDAITADVSRRVRWGKWYEAKK